MLLWVTLAYVFAVGFIAGFLLKAFLVRNKKEDYSGTIVVSTDKELEKTVYSLELDDYPETLRFKKAVVFKVDNKRVRRGRR